MGLFYSIPDNEILTVRNKVFTEKGIPALEKNGFTKSSFSNTWFGKNNLGDYTYSMHRLSDANLEIITTHICKGDTWIQNYLNIFKLNPEPRSLLDLSNNDGIHFDLPPNSITNMRLREDDFKGMPLFNFVHHKLKSYNSKSGFENSVKRLGDLITKDLHNIDYFVKRWHEIHKPLITDWQGKQITQ